MNTGNSIKNPLANFRARSRVFRNLEPARRPMLRECFHHLQKLDRFALEMVRLAELLDEEARRNGHEGSHVAAAIADAFDLCDCLGETDATS